MCVVAELRAIDASSSHQFEGEIGAASSENGLFIAKMEFSIQTGLLGNRRVTVISNKVAKWIDPNFSLLELLAANSMWCSHLKTYGGFCANRARRPYGTPACKVTDLKSKHTVPVATFCRS
jgi:hypothetical protein